MASTRTAVKFLATTDASAVGTGQVQTPAADGRSRTVTIDLVVVNYHTPGDLSACVASIERHAAMDYTLTVVDVEAGRDGPLPRLPSTANYVPTRENVGYGQACNIGATYGTSDLVAFFNADVELTPNALRACCDALAEHPEWAILGPRQVDGQGRIRHAGVFGTNRSPHLRGWNSSGRGDAFTDVDEAVSVAGSAYFVRRHVLDSLAACPRFRAIAPDAKGAFLPTPHYYEETWVSYHARAHGWSVVYFGQATLIHQWHRASPIGGHADQAAPRSRSLFRAACQHHDIACD
jgi:GT2 family glycosyltransferase